YSSRRGLCPAFHAASKRSQTRSIRRAAAGDRPTGERSDASSLSIPTSFLFCSHASPLTLILLTPNDADRIQLARDRPPRALELAGDLVVREAFHLPNRDSRQSVVAEAIEQALVLFGDLGREGGRGLVAHNLGDSGLLPLRSHPRFAVRRATATPL